VKNVPKIAAPMLTSETIKGGAEVVVVVVVVVVEVVAEGSPHR
jgi:hypothetical protein